MQPLNIYKWYQIPLVIKVSLLQIEETIEGANDEQRTIKAI